MIGVDMVLYDREKITMERIEKEQSRKRKYDEAMAQSQPLSPDSNSDSDKEAIDYEIESIDDIPLPALNDATQCITAKRGSHQFITPRLTSALDNA